MAATQQLKLIITAVDQASRTLNGITRSAETMGDKMKDVGKRMTMSLTLPIVAIGAAATKFYADFDAQLKNIQAVTGATASEMDKVKAVAIEMGQKTAFSATEAVEGMQQLLSSGYDLNQTFTALKPVMDLAAAGTLDLGYTADAVTDILAQFQLGAEQSTMVANTLAAAAQSSSATIEDLISAFSNVGPIAKMFGMSVEETAATLAVFAENGIKSSEAGTQLKSMLGNMTRNTNTVQAAWERLGISMYDANGQVRALDDVIDDINRVMKEQNMTQQEQINIVTALGGQYGKLGLAALLAADGNDAMQAQMKEAATAAEMAQAQMDSFQGAMNQLKSSVQTLMIVAIGPFVENYLKPLVQWFTKILNAISAVDPRLMGLITSFVALAAALGPVLWIGGKIKTEWLILKKVFTSLPNIIGLVNKSMLFLAANPIVLVIAAGVALGVAIYALIQHFGGLQAVVDRFNQGMENLRNLLTDVILNGWEKFKQIIEDVKNSVLDFINNAWGKFNDMLGGLPDQMLQAGKAIVSGLIKGLWEGFVDILRWADNVGKGIESRIKGFFGIGSPSTLMYDVGTNVSLGMVMGMRDTMYRAAPETIQASAEIGARVGQAWGEAARATMTQYASLISGTLGGQYGQSFANAQANIKQGISVSSGGLGLLSQLAFGKKKASSTAQLSASQKQGLLSALQASGGNFTSGIGAQFGVAEDNPAVAWALNQLKGGGGGKKASSTSSVVPGMGGGGGKVVINIDKIMITEKTTRKQVKELMKELGKEIRRKGQTAGASA